MDRSLPWWLRATFFFIAIQCFDFALALFRPDLITALEPWKATPLNARFIASLYLATGMAYDAARQKIVLFTQTASGTGVCP